ncbi:hypothetical protein PE36_07127 [Moritella sp. PE36]|nr:hypothetical protein PE36_07127 [Moritella sp. PE36]
MAKTTKPQQAEVLLSLIFTSGFVNNLYLHDAY